MRNEIENALAFDIEPVGELIVFMNDAVDSIN